MKHSLSLDQFFRSTLRNYESPVADDLFDRIMAERRKQRAGFWYRTGGKMASFSLLLLLAGISGYSPASKKSVNNLQNIFASSYLPVETAATALRPVASIFGNKSSQNSVPETTSEALTLNSSDPTNQAEHLDVQQLENKPVKPASMAREISTLSKEYPVLTSNK